METLTNRPMCAAGCVLAKRVGGERDQLTPQTCEYVNLLSMSMSVCIECLGSEALSGAR